jgi:hypothetical protein
VPGNLFALVSNPVTAERVMKELHAMTKLDLRRLQEAAESQSA